MYRYLLKPKWLAGHLLFVVMVTFFVWAGFWQLSRLSDAQAERDLGVNRVEAQPVPLAEIAAETDLVQRVYRRVIITGEFLADQQVATPPRSRNGQPGNILLTPFQPDDGSRPVLIERGWVPFQRGGVIAAAPPSGQVTVAGVLLPPEAPDATEVFNDAGLVRYINPTPIGAELGLDLAPLTLRLLDQSPAQSEPLPIAGALPEFDLGSHLSYAVQWFLFALVSVIGYPILIRRTTRDRETPAPIDDRVAVGVNS